MFGSAKKEGFSPRLRDSSEILVRDMEFRFHDSIGARWCDDDVEFAYIVNGFMFSLPPLEAYFIRNMREASKRVKDPALVTQMTRYSSQEARHASAHARFNGMLKKSYPGLRAIEVRIKERLERSLSRHSLDWRLAYTAGYEAVTYHLSEFFLNNGQRWFQKADRRVFGFLSWHMIEEIEHRSVAFDTLRAVNDSWFLRVRAYFAALVATVHEIQQVVAHLVREDRRRAQSVAGWRLWQVAFRLLFALLPGFRHHILPGHHPGKLPEPCGVASWKSRYLEGDELRVLSPDEVAGDQLVKA